MNFVVSLYNISFSETISFSAMQQSLLIFVEFFYGVATPGQPDCAQNCERQPRIGPVSSPPAKNK